jgi:hypothetical protein
MPLRSLGRSPVRFMDLFDKMEHFMALINQEVDACIGLSPRAVNLIVTVGKTQS